MKKNKKGAGRPVILPPPWGELSTIVGGTKKLSEKFGVSGATINRWANGVHNPSELAKKELKRLCKKYGFWVED